MIIIIKSDTDRKENANVGREETGSQNTEDQESNL